MKQMIVTSAVNDVTDNVEETILCLSMVNNTHVQGDSKNTPKI